MAQVAQAEQSRAKRSAGWLLITLMLLFVAVLATRDASFLLWSVATAAAAPLSLVATLAMLLLPGLAALRLLWREPLAIAERWPLAIGISCALYPLLLLLSSFIGLRWNAWLCWGLLGLCGVALIWPWRNATLIRQAISANWGIDYEHALLIIITVATVAVRLYAAHDLPAGMWGDSYQHTMIAQLLVNNGGLFSSWQPYAPLATFTYHFGFHSNVAWLHWLSGAPVTSGLLIVGQIQSALAAPLIYLLTRRLINSPAAALWAALIVGVASAMPAYYLNWGRYTQLAGQTILPAACVIWMALLDRSIPSAPEPRTQNRETVGAHRDALLLFRSLPLRLILLIVLTTVGLALTHYRVAIFAACFVAAYAIYVLLARVRSWWAFGWLCSAGLIAGGLTLLVIWPWLLRLREGLLLRIGQRFVSTNIGAGETNALPPMSDILTLHMNFYLLALALLGYGALAWQRSGRGMALTGAGALVILAANPYLIGLTGAGVLTNFAVLLANYVLLAPLAGAAIVAAITAVSALFSRCTWLPSVIGWGQVAVGAIVLVWGLGWQQQIVALQYQLLTPADARAMDWIRQETPPDAVFLVNSFPAYGNTLYAGSDGGWWLPLLTGRHTNLPPLTYGSEAAEQTGYFKQVNSFNADIRKLLQDSPDQAAATLQAAGYRYLYNGPAANPDNEPIKPDLLARSSRYELVYDKDGVTIWKVR